MTPWTISHQAPLSMGFSGQEYWGGLPFPSPGDLTDPGIEPMSLQCRQILYQLRDQGSCVKCYQTALHATEKSLMKTRVNQCGQLTCWRDKRFRFDPWVRKIPWRREWQLALIFFPGETHGQRSQAGYSP